jgi:predicted aminopeptidase
VKAAPLALLALVSSGCLYTQYVAQAANGQLELLANSKSLDDVIADPSTPLRTAMLLSQIPEIKWYGRSYGLRIRNNYERYTALGRPAAVWFVGGADPVAFKPTRWCFPVAGCFAGLGWFDEDEAIKFKLELEAQGFDALVRPAAAYSTGGWFPDPVLSSMLGGGDSALPDLANVVLHESVHATVFVPDEPFFNESFASYVADALTDHWIEIHFGPGSPEEMEYTLGEALRYPRTLRTLAAYEALKEVYTSKRTRDQKLAEKAKIIDQLVADLKLRKRPNNASLTESRVYNGGATAIADAHKVCGDLAALIAAGKHLGRGDFQKTLQDDLVPIGKRLGDLCQVAKQKHR